MKNRAFHLTLTCMAIAALTACGGSSSDTASSSSATSTNPTTTSAPIPLADCGLPDFKNELLSRLNAYRTSGLTCGTEVMPPTTPVVWDETLQQAATIHANDMAAHNFLSHTGSDGSTIADRLARVGFVVNGPAYENAGGGSPTVMHVMEGWRNSPLHCKGMMIATHKKVAVSCAANPATTYKYFWVMEIGA
jgi:uncharacterized protein YkwD